MPIRRVSARTAVLDLFLDRVPISLAQGGDLTARRPPAVEAFHEPVTVRLRRAGPALALVGIVGLFPASVVAVASANFALAATIGADPELAVLDEPTAELTQAEAHEAGTFGRGLTSEQGPGRAGDPGRTAGPLAADPGSAPTLPDDDHDDAR